MTAIGSAGELRARIRAEVLSRRPIDARERDSIVAFRLAFDALERPFDEHAGPVHVTASAVIVGENGPDGHGVVLHRHKRLGLWLQPGGHIDDGEMPWDAALREAQEETGLPATHPADMAHPPRIAHVDVHPGGRGHTHLDVRYVLHSPPVAPQPEQGESQGVAWFGWTEAIGLTDAGLAGLLRVLRPPTPTPPPPPPAQPIDQGKT